MDITFLIKQPESKTLEFKRDLSSLAPIIKTLVAFANTAGGTLIIGCSNEGQILGLKDVLKEEERLATAIGDSIQPTLLPEIEIATVQGKNLLIVKVAHWKGPFYVKKEGSPNGVYMRLGSTSRPASSEMVLELQRSVFSLSFDQQPLPDVSFDDLNADYIEKMFGKKLDKEKLCSLGILVPHAGRFVASIGGVILFGKPHVLQRFVPDARISCARFLGNSKAHILDRFEVEGTILEAISAVPKFISRNTRLAATFTNIYREDIPEYPSVALREVLMNALAHSDYSILGSHIQVAIYDDRLEIQNPGMLPLGFTLEDLKSGVSRVRNRVIARVFHELKLMESWGSGYRRCLEDCKRGNYPNPEWNELGATVRVIFYPHQKTKLVVKEEPASYGKDLEELNQREQKILALFTPGVVLPFRELHRILKEIPERTLRYDLAKLREKQVLVSKGKGPATVWRLSNGT